MREPVAVLAKLSLKDWFILTYTYREAFAAARPGTHYSATNAMHQEAERRLEAFDAYHPDL